MGCRWLYAAGALFLLLTNASALFIPWLLKVAIDALGKTEGEYQSSAVYALAIIAVAIIHGVTRVFSRTYILNAARLVEFEIREDLFKVLLRQDAGFFNAERTGDLISRFSNDLTNVRMLAGFGAMNLINCAILYGAATYLMVKIHPLLTLFAVLPFPIMVLMVRVISRKMFQLSMTAQEELAGLSSHVEESVSSLSLIRTCCREDCFGEMFAGASGSYLASSLAVARLRGLVLPVMAMATGAGMLVVLFFGGKLVVSGEMTLGDFVAFSGYLAMLVWPTAVLGWIINLMQRGAASMSRITHVMDHLPAVVETDDHIVLSTVQLNIEFRDVWLSHDGREILKGVSLNIRAGERIGITGRVGGGKSSLLKLLPRIQDVSRGGVYLDGFNIRDIGLGSLRKLIGYVPQEPFLFSRTIRENIEMGLQTNIGGPELEDLLERSGLSSDVSAFAAGVDTLVGERGVTLSGGQKQRLALARAIAGNPQILLLDDPLSAVDADTEHDILNRLNGWYGGKTVILVSQRVSAIHGCDRVLVVDDGVVIEEGAPEDLLSRGGAYAGMYRAQQVQRELDDQ